MEFVHQPVLLRETLEALRVRPDGIYLDGTVGGAGHAREIARRLTTGRLLALDQDPDAVAVARERLAGLPAEVIERNFSDLAAVLDERGIPAVDGILLDLGVSSWQLDQAERGFSYRQDAPLDMRMRKQGTSAADLIATLDRAALADLFRRYGEEPFAGKIASAIVARRQTRPIETTGDLAALIAASVPPAARRDGHPARRCFQALRIAVNGELEVLDRALDDAIDRLAPGGVLAVITFHSLEDRMVKHRFLEACRGCTCPPDLPVCVCGKKPRGYLPQRKGVTPGAQELEANPRSRSAKLRWFVKNETNDPTETR